MGRPPTSGGEGSPTGGSVLAILLALGTAVGYGTANYLAPVLGRRMPLATVLLGSQLAGLVVSVLVTVGSDVAMDAQGLDSHGVSRVPRYLELFDMGESAPDAAPRSSDRAPPSRSWTRTARRARSR